MWKLESISPAVVASLALPAAGHGWRRAAAVTLQHDAWAKGWQCKNCSGKFRWDTFWNSRFLFCELKNTQMHKWGCGGVLCVRSPPRTHRAAHEPPQFRTVSPPQSLSQLVFSPASLHRLLRARNVIFLAFSWSPDSARLCVCFATSQGGALPCVRATLSALPTTGVSGALPRRHACHPTLGSPHPIPAHVRGREWHHNNHLAYSPLSAGSWSLCMVKSYKLCSIHEEFYNSWGREVQLPDFSSC